jgi:hypothetical protein
MSGTKVVRARKDSPAESVLSAIQDKTGQSIIGATEKRREKTGRKVVGL